MSFDNSNKNLYCCWWDDAM